MFLPSMQSILLLVVAFPNPCLMGLYDWDVELNEPEGITEVPPNELPTDLPQYEPDHNSMEGSLVTVKSLEVGLHDTNTPETTIQDISISTKPDFRAEFALFETRMKSFISNVRREQLATISNKRSFLEKIDEYAERLPKNATAIVTLKTRDFCHCEGEMMRPCPLKCMYSCYAYNDYAFRGGWRYEDDCRNLTLRGCQCIQGSSIECASSLDKCLNQTTKYLNADKSCPHYSVDKQDLVKSFDLIVNLLVEPLEIYFRGAESQLTFLRQATYSIDSLSEIAAQMCPTPGEPTCSSEAQLLLSTEKKNYLQKKRNITLEMIKTQGRIEEVSKNVDKLKEEAFAKINRSIKEYSCCLKGLNFTIDGYDCSDVTKSSISNRASTESTSKRQIRFACPYTMYECDDKCIHPGLVCDGITDCDDGNDEAHCPAG